MASEYRQNTSYEVIKKDYTSPTVEVSEGSDEVGGGNKYSLPFGLCKGVGIDTTGMTPREAWDAYTGKTGISKEQAEKEHWGKASSNTGGEKNDNSSQVKWKKDDVIKIGGLTARVLDVDREGRTVVEVLEGERGLRRPGSKFMFMKNSPAAESAEIVTDNLQTDSNTADSLSQTNESNKKQGEALPITTTRDENGHYSIARYSINEDTARRAKEAYSHWGYQEGSCTEKYLSRVETFEKKVNELIDRNGWNKTLTDEDRARVDKLVDAYSKNLANYLNEDNRITASYPSWMIAGPANYNVRKAEKKNAQTRALFQENENKIDPTNNYYLDKISSILSNQTIKSNDSNAIGKLTEKLERLKLSHEAMKQASAYYRKNGTYKGFEHPGLTAEKLAETEAFQKKYGFGGFNLAGSNAEIRRVQSRIDELNKIKTSTSAPETATSKYPQAKGVTVQENAEQMRVQLRFEGKPNEETRTLLKSHGFRWSPSQGAWQRQLTGNGKYAAKQIMQKLSEKGE